MALNDWKTGQWAMVAEPGGLPTCLMSFFCPCVTYGLLVSKIDAGTADVMAAGNCLAAGGIFCCAQYFGCPCLVHLPTRNSLRSKYNIKPSSGLVEDVLLTWCCGCCLLCQEYNEVVLQTGEKGDYFTDLKGTSQKAVAEVKKTQEGKQAEKQAEKVVEAAVVEQKKEETLVV